VPTAPTGTPPGKPEVGILVADCEPGIPGLPPCAAGPCRDNIISLIFCAISTFKPLTLGCIGGGRLAALMALRGDEVDDIEGAALFGGARRDGGLGNVSGTPSASVSFVYLDAPFSKLLVTSGEVVCSLLDMVNER